MHFLLNSWQVIAFGVYVCLQFSYINTTISTKKCKSVSLFFGSSLNRIIIVCAFLNHKKLNFCFLIINNTFMFSKRRYYLYIYLYIVYWIVDLLYKICVYKILKGLGFVRLHRIWLLLVFLFVCSSHISTIL